MITRHDSLDQALAAVETKTLHGVAMIVVSRQWWGGLAPREQEVYRQRAEHAGIALHADETLSSHYVEARGESDGPALSTEQPM